MVPFRAELIELKPRSDDAFKDETNLELFTWYWIVEIIVSTSVLKSVPGEEISDDDCSIPIVLEMIPEYAVVFLIELSSMLEDSTKTEVLPEFMIVHAVEFSKELKSWSDIEFKAELIEIRLWSDEAVKDETLPVLLDWDRIVEIFVCSPVLKSGSGKEILDDDCSNSFVLKM